MERTPSSHQADFAELEKALAELKPGLPESHPLTRLANFTGQPDQGRLRFLEEGLTIALRWM